MKVTVMFSDKETNEMYNKTELHFQTLEEVLKYLEKLHKKLTLNYTYVKYEITDKKED